MRILHIQSLILAAGCILSLPAIAGVGASNAGVTTTVPNQDPTQPSADVQSQSSGFVQQNQQLQNQQNQAHQGPNGIVLPGAVTGNGSQAGATSGANAANASNNGAPGAAAQTPPPPPPPPAPPPVYQSVIKPVVRDTPQSSDVAAGQTLATTASPSAVIPTPNKSVPATPPPEHAQPPVKQPPPAKPVQPHPSDPTPAAVVPAPVNAGGRGNAPEGYTFLLGLLATGGLLAFALVTYLRIGRGGSNDS